MSKLALWGFLALLAPATAFAQGAPFGPSGGGGVVNWPTAGDIVIAPSSGNPTGLAPSVSGDCVLVSGSSFALGACGAGSNGLSGMTAGQLPVAASVNSVTSSHAFGLTGVSTILETDSSGNMDAPVNTTTGTFSGNLTTNVTGVIQCLHVSTAGVISGTGADCGSGGGSLTVTDGTNSVSSTTTLSLGNGFGVSGTSPTATVAMKSPDRTQTTTGGSVAAGDMAGQVNLNGSSLAFSVPAIGAGVWNTGASAILNDLNSTSVALTNTATVNGCGTTLYSGGFFSYTSNGTSLDCFGFPGFGWMAANAITVSTVTGQSRVVTTGTTDTLLSSDCGKEVLYNLAAFTVTVPSAIVPASGSVCTIRIRTATANKVTITGSGVTVTSADSYTGTQAVAGSGISLDLTTVGATATAYLDGHGS